MLREIDWFEALLLAALVLYVNGCSSCQTFYRYDGGASARPYYRLDICRDRDGKTTTTLVCDSPNRLPNQQCK